MYEAQLDSSLNRNKNNGIDNFFVVAVCFYIITWYLQLGSRVAVLGAIRFEFLLGAFLTIAAFFKLFSVKSSFSPPLRNIVIIYIFTVVFYTVFSYDRPRSFDVLLNRVIKFSMLALFISAFARTEWALKMVVAAFLIAMAKLGQEGLFGWISGGLMWQNQGIMRLHGSTLLYRHPNSLSGMAVGTLPFIFYLFPIVNKWQKLFLAFLLLCATIIIIFTGSRTGYVATILLIIFMGWKILRNNKLKLLVASIAALIFVPLVVPEEYKERFISIYTMEEAEGASSETRIQILEDAISIFISNPFGVGVAAFPKVREDVFNRTQDTHNLYLELLTNLGFLGTAVFIIFIYKMIRINQVTARLCEERSRKFTAAICRATIAFLMARLFLGLFGMDTYEIYWWLAAGLTSSCFYISKSKEEK